MFARPMDAIPYFGIVRFLHACCTAVETESGELPILVLYT